MASDDLSVHSTRVGLQMSAELVGAPWWDTANGTVGCRVLPVEQVAKGDFPVAAELARRPEEISTWGDARV